MIYEKISGFSDEISSDISTQFNTLNRLGINFFEPRGVDGKNISLLNDDEVQTLLKKMNKYNIKASSIGSPIGKIKVSDDFEQHFKLYKKIVDIAKKLGASYIRIFSFYHDGQAWTNEERNVIFSRVGRMIDYAKKENVILLHENEKDIYGDTAERCLDLMKNFYCDNFKAVFDPANFVQSGEDTKKAFEIMRPYIAYVHIKDAKFVDGSVVPAGFGDGNIEGILRNLFKNGFNGFLSLEPHLGSFGGLENLEMGDLMMNLPKSGEDTFTLAYDALKSIIERI